MFGDFFAKLFGNNQKASAPAPRQQAQPNRLTQMPSMGGNNSRPMVDLAAQAREEERRRREEERKAREAAEQARKVKEAADAKAKEIKTQEQQANQQKLKTAGPLAPNQDMFKLQPPGKPRNASIQGVSEKDLSIAAEMKKKGKDPTGYLNAARNEAKIKQDGKMGVHTVALEGAKATGTVADWARRNIVGGGIDWLGQTASRVAETADRGATLGIRSLQDLRDPNKSAAQRSKDIAIDNKRFKGYADDRAKFDKDIARLFGEDIATNAEYDREAQNISQGKGSAGELFSAATKSFGVEGAFAGLTGRQAAKATGRALDGVVDDTVYATQKSLARSNADNAVKQAEQEIIREADDAVRQLPDQVQIQQQASDAGKIDDGIVSPSRSQKVETNLTQEVERQRAEIQQNYSTQLMGLDEMRQSLLPKPLATELAGAPDLDPGMMARQADFEPPVVQPTPELPQLEAPMKAPLVQAADTPLEAASKQVAADTPPAPVIKTSNMDEMTDEQVFEKFKKTREEILASRAELEAQKSQKAQRNAGKEERKLARAAAAEQAAIDAGEAPNKDIFAGKKRTTAAEAEPELPKLMTQEEMFDATIKNTEKKTTGKKDIFAGQRRIADDVEVDAATKAAAKSNMDKVKVGNVVTATDGKQYTVIEKPFRANGQDAVTVLDNQTKKMVTLRDTDLTSVTQQTTAPKTTAKDIFAGKKKTDAPTKEAPSKAAVAAADESTAAVEKLRKQAESDNLGESVKANRVLKAYKTVGEKGGKATKKDMAAIRKAEKDLAKHEKNMAAEAKIMNADPTDFSTPSKTKDIFAGKKKADTAPTKEAPAKAVPATATRAELEEIVNTDGLPAFKRKQARDQLRAMDDKAKADADKAFREDPENIPAFELKAKAKAAGKTVGEYRADLIAKKAPTKEAPIEAAPIKEAPTKEAPAKKTAEVKEELATPSTRPTIEKVKTGDRKVSQSQSIGGKQSRAMYDEVSRDKTGEAAQNYAKNVPFREYAADALKRKKTPEDDLIARAYVAQGRIEPGTPEWGQLKKIIQEARTGVGQDMSILARFFREKASSREITLDYEKRFDKLDLVDMDENAVKRIDELGADYTKARDAANAAREKAIGSKSKSDVDEFERLFEEARQKDLNQKIAAYDEVIKTLNAMEKKGMKLSEAQITGVKKMLDETSIFEYDASDASILSATGTMINNAVNGLTVGLEPVLFGRLGGFISGKIHGKTVGGYSLKGSRMGAKEGLKVLTKEWNNRKQLHKTGNAGFAKRGWGAYKNVVTTANEMSEVPIRARINSALYDHYRIQNKKAGLKGDALKQQTRLDTLTDPMDKREGYAIEAYDAQGMSALSKSSTATKRLETAMVDGLEGLLKKIPGTQGGKARRALTRHMAKSTVRVLVGFPSVVWRSGVVAGSKRVPLLGQVIDASRYAMAKTTDEKALIMAEGIQHLGSGLTYSAVGAFMGAAGIVTGAYPEDPNEQDRWDAEGKAEWSIKLPIIDPKTGKVTHDYYDLRKSLGAFALPLMISAQMGQNMAAGEDRFKNIMPGIEDGKLTRSALTALLDVSPVESSLGGVNDLVEIFGGGAAQAKASSLIAKGVRIHMPVSSFTNEIAKIVTALNSGTELEARDAENFGKEIINRLAVAFPGMGEKLNLDAKQSKGVDIAAVSPFGKILGAQKGSNEEGEALVAKQQSEADRQAESTRSVNEDTYNKVLETMDEDTQGLYKKVVKEGRSLSPEKQKKVDDAIAGLADSDKDFESKFTQEGDWTSQEYVLAKKKGKFEADKSTKPEKLQELDREIGRTGILKSNNSDPKTYKKYKDTAQSDLKKMLDDEDLDNYDPDTAKMLLEMDEMFTKAGLSWNTTDDEGWTKNKYDLAKIQKALAARGGGGGSGKNLLETNVNVMKVNESEGLGELKYKTVSGVPNVMAATPRKNFKKTISVKAGVQL